MNSPLLHRRLAALAVFLVAIPTGWSAGVAESAYGSSPIDLAAALRLAGAQDIEVAIAREKLAEAQAELVSAQWRFFPWIEPGITLYRHDNLYQNGQGQILEAHKEFFAVGPSFRLKLDLGDAIYSRLAARQLVRAAASGLEGQRQEAILAAARGYLDLAVTQLAVGVMRDAVKIAEDYKLKVRQAVEDGHAFEGDALHVQVQADRNRLELRRGMEEVQLAAARLADTLHLDPAMVLIASENELVPVNFLTPGTTRGSLISRALANRPELVRSQAETEAAQAAQDGATYGPLYPNIGVDVFAGELGGSSGGVNGETGQTEDYLLTVGWRIGPGGLFDQGRISAAEARLRVARLTKEKVTDAIIRQVVENYIRLQSLGDQVEMARHALDTATEALRLSKTRGDFAVGVVLAELQAQQELTRTRLDFLRLVASFDEAGFALQHAVGAL